MAKGTNIFKKLDPAGFVLRHGGVVFVCVALGLAISAALHVALIPKVWHADAEISYTPRQDLDAFARIEERTPRWEGFARDLEAQDWLTTGLRGIVRRAATTDLQPDSGALQLELAMFKPSRTWPASTLPFGLGGAVTLTLRDVAENMDFQTLALVAADMEPESGAADWDFSFFDADAAQDITAMVTRPGPTDPCFRVFYKLYSLLNGGNEAPSPRSAWAVTVEEVTRRLTNESNYSGGGFGRAAKREIQLELAAIPVLAANSLLFAMPWAQGGGARARAVWTPRWNTDAEMQVFRQGSMGGRIRASMDIALWQLAAPHDHAYTRIPHLCVAALLAFAAADEPDAPQAAALAASARAYASLALQPRPAPEAEADQRTEPPASLEADESAPVAAASAEADEEEQNRQGRIQELRAGLRIALTEVDAARRALDALRMQDEKLLAEALDARGRADRLQARAAAIAADAEHDAGATLPELEALRMRRAEIAARIRDLLRTCTEEHPFVREARRDLAITDEMLAASKDRMQRAAQAVQDNASRIYALGLEAESARDRALNLEERRRRLSAELDAARAALDAAERRAADLDIQLTRLAAEQARRQHPTPAPAPASTAAAAATAPAPAPRPQPASVRQLPPLPRAESARTEEEPFLPAAEPDFIFGPVPDDISVTAVQVASGSGQSLPALLGLALGLAIAMIRELTSRRFRTPREAARKAGLPLLASLPRYDAKTFRAAAAESNGQAVVDRKDGGVTFIPAPVETAEPLPRARRAKVRAAAPRRPVALFAVGVLLLAAAAALLLLPARLAAAPAGAPAVLPVPAAKAWGNLP